MRGRWIALAAGAAVAMLLSGAATPPTDGPRRDGSGLLVVPVHEAAIPASIREAYGKAMMLSQENPDDFGTPTVEGGRVVLSAIGARAGQLASGSVESRRGAFDAYLAERKLSASSRGTAASKLRTPQLSPVERDAFLANVSFQSGGRSRSQTSAMSDAVFDLQFDAQFKAAHIWQSEVDPVDGSVVLSVENLTPALAERIVRDYGTDAVHLRISPQPESWPASRPHDTSPFYGGDLIGTPTGICTGGFAWGGNTMVSAGHCYPTGGSVVIDGTTIGTVASGSAENWTSGVGTVYLSGSTVYRGDISLIGIVSGKSSTGRIFRGDSSSTTSAAVGEMWSRSPVAGDQYCSGGSQSGEVCGWTVSNVGINHTYSDGEVLRNAVQSSYKQGWCIRPGDSGGPVYTVRSDGKVAAKGLINGAGGGGGDYYGGATDPCIMWFTDIYQAYYAFPGTIQTS